MAPNESAKDEIYDVIVVGYGPTGMAACGLLGKAGLSVGMFERWPSLYGLPRAGHIDHEILRVLQEIGAAEEYTKRAWANESYVAIDGNGDELMEMDWSHPGISGWYSDWFCPQDELEEVLNEAIAKLPSVELNPGWEAYGFEETAEYVEVRLRENVLDEHGSLRQSGRTRAARARYVIAADGAGSFFRETLGIERRDLGYKNDWVVVDLQPNDPDMHIDMPYLAQIMNPARPALAVRRLGRRLSKFEWMVLPGEDPAEVSGEAFVWDYLGRNYDLTPENSTLVRNIAYTFRTLIANRWNTCRILLAGDAAHVMPPFMAQGMCSGIRDSKAITWRLEAILGKSLAPEPLLASYQLEREPQVESITRSAIHMGSMVATTDPVKAAERDRRIKQGELTEPEPVPPLRDGLFHRTGGVVVAPAGTLSLQAFVTGRSGRYGRFDDIVGHGWLVLSFEDTRSALSEKDLELLDRLGAHLVRLTPSTNGTRRGVADTDGKYRAWFDELGAEVVMVRPDFYVYGAGASIEDLAPLVAELREQLHASSAAKK